MPSAECRRWWLYSWIQARTRARACALVAKCSSARSSNSRVECQDPLPAVSSAEPGRPIDWRMHSRPQACADQARGVFAALVGVQDHAGDLPAARRHRHRQRAVGQLRIVVLAEREPEHPPGGHVQDRGQVELALTGGDLGAVAVPLAVDLLAGKSRLTRSGARQRSLPGRVVAVRFFFRRAARPCSRISAATVFSLTRQPASRRSAVIRGRPVRSPVSPEQPPDLRRQRRPCARARGESRPPLCL